MGFAGLSRQKDMLSRYERILRLDVLINKLESLGVPDIYG
jgi:hypothetical protein